MAFLIRQETAERSGGGAVAPFCFIKFLYLRGEF